MKEKIIARLKKLKFESKFFGSKPWKYSNKEDMRYQLWLEEVKQWLMDTYNIHLNICHRVHSQTNYFYITSGYDNKNDDLLQIIYEEKYSKYKKYIDALECGVYISLTKLIS